MEVVVEYDYGAEHEDELTLRPGDVIRNVRRVEEEGWMEGELNGRRGLFPDNFVKEVKKDEVKKEGKDPKEVKNEVKEESAQPHKREKSPGNVANLVQRMSVIGIPTGGFQPQSQSQPPAPPPAKKKPKKRQCKALFDYQPENEDELELKVGDIIDIIEEVEEGWWSGIVNGKSGLFPSNFVKELDTAAEKPESNDTTASDETEAGIKEAAGTPTSPLPTPGNGVIAQPKKVRGVGFGNIFREGSVKLKVRLPSPEKEEKKDIMPIPSLPSAAKPVHSTTSTTSTTTTTTTTTPDSQRTDGDTKSKVKENCKVLFAFEGSKEDELTLKEGDVIQILSKDTGEPGWWRGAISGREGVFPDNFVTMISELDKEVPTSRASLKLPAKQESDEVPTSRASLKSPAKQESEEVPSRSSLKLPAKQESEERPKKPPPPSKVASKPEVPSADRKPHISRSEDRVDKGPQDKPSKPAAPVVPPKKPIPPPGKGRPGSIPPKRPDKPTAPSQSLLKHNGEVLPMRPKSDIEPLVSSKPRTMSGDWGERVPDTDTNLISFDDVSSTSVKLSHLTADRPKIHGRRLPAQFVGGQSPNKEVSVEKSFKMDDEEVPKLKLTEPRKLSINSTVLPPSVLKHTPPAVELKPSGEAPSQGSRARLESEDQGAQLEELRSQMKELLHSMELLKSQQMKEIAELREDLNVERSKRVSLQMEMEKLKRTVQST